MTTLLRHLYAFMIHWTEFELTLYRSTSGNMALIDQAQKDLDYWTLEAHKLEWRMQ